VDWLVGQCNKAGAKMKLNVEADSRAIEQFKPDTLVVAAGASPLVQTIPGATSKNVITYEEALTQKLKWDKKQVVVAGGGDIGSETAEFLARKGANVTIVEMLPELAPDMEFQNRFLLLTRLGQLGVNVKTNHLLEGIKGNNVTIIDLQNMKRKDIAADYIVLAMGIIPNDDLARNLRKQLKDKVKEIHFIGDCVEPRKAVHAIHQGSFIARQI